MADITGEKVLDFLARQRLRASPGNYALGYHAVTGENAGIAKAVLAITDDGVRITQAEADAIMRANGIDVAPSAPADEGNARILHEMLRFSDIAADTRDATTSFGADLQRQMAEIGDAADIARLVAGMVARTNAAESRLAASIGEMDRMRQDLQAARTDATRDALTGLPNRRAIDAALADMAARGASRAIAICDVDHFKRVNDTYGHAVGDRVLRTVANAIAEACPGHLVGRWGGEEFVIVMEGVGEAAAAAQVDAAREHVSTRRYKLRENDAPLGAVTFSAGVSTLDDVDAASHRADELLYAAKAAGRNRVMADGTTPMRRAA